MTEQAGARRRTRKATPRQKVVKVRLSDDEYADVDARAAASRLTVPGYLALRGLEDLAAPKPAASGSGLTPVQLRALVAELYALKRILRGSATNLNQLAMVANATGEVRPAALQHARRIAETLARFEAFVETLRPLVEP